MLHRVLFSVFLNGMASSCLLMPAVSTCSAGESKVSLEQLDGKIRVEVDGKLFTEYVYQGFAKPIFYPVLAPGQIPMTRSYPIVQGVAGEATDHPHHKSIWFAHGDVNGTSFWDERGKIEHERIVDIDENPKRPSITTTNRWLTLEDKLVCTDTMKIVFRTLPGARAIDWTTTIHASAGDLKFGDTKEGMMGLRTHPSLRLDNAPEHGVTTANGESINSEGVKNHAMWGKHAKWLDYSGEIDGHRVGIAIFDHPKNLRHPTTWHAREYGLVTANPFGLSYFENKPAGSGDYTLRSGKDLTFRYLLVFHQGGSDEAKIADLYEDFAAE